MQIDTILHTFHEHFQGEPLIAKAPGRVNLIGEHTDYNDGFVLPAAIDKEMVFALAKNNTGTVRAYALDLKEHGEFSLESLQVQSGWINYLIGVVAEMKKRGVKIEGFDAVFSSDVPLGAGMSSSAALECALGTGLNHLFAGELNQQEIALSAQAAEHNYAGVKCGIMDQFASTFGKAGHVIKLDCRSMSWEYIPLDISGYKLVLCDTNVAHSLASSEYNIRREQCEVGVQILQQYYPEIKNLRDVTIAMLEKHCEEFDATIYQRCSYVVKENNRLENACQSLQAGDLEALGQLMYGSHAGLSHAYEVSCEELDFLVDQTRDNPQVVGARMMGGGFGGCTINLVKEEAVDTFIFDLREAYMQAFGKEMKAYTVVTGDGARIGE
ncbi:galactokinase [Rapidithrix thailandica]|uniref:Galactokinase n=1 Tax=Rapidithrix thailandica TaxID=413964 RepID=A0AAW9S0N6_9BACT